MENIFKIKRSYRVRHKILKFPYEECERNPSIASIGSIRIAATTGIPIKEVHQLSQLLAAAGDVIISDND